MKLIWCLLAVLCLAGCATGGRIPLGNSIHSTVDAKVVLIPMEGFNVEEVDEIAGSIEMRQKLYVRTYTTMGKNTEMFDAEKGQFISEEIAKVAWEVLQNNGDANSGKAIIVLTKNDINSRDSRMRYVFSSHFSQAKLSVISTARIDPANYGQLSDKMLIMRRLAKLIDKSLGLNLYGYAIGTDKKSVMYGPIMSPSDLDSIGDSY